MTHAFAVDQAETLINHVSGTRRTTIRWKPSGLVALPGLSTPDGRSFTVTTVTYTVNDDDVTMHFTGYPVTAKNHRPLAHDRTIPVVVPTDDWLATFMEVSTSLNKGRENGDVLAVLEPVRCGSVRYNDSFFQKMRAAERV